MGPSPPRAGMGLWGPAVVAHRKRCSGTPNGFAVERPTPVDRAREGRGATLAGRPDRAGRASGVTGPDGAWPGGAVPAGPPTPSRAFKRCDDPSGPRAGTVTTGVGPFQLLVGPQQPFPDSGGIGLLLAARRKRAPRIGVLQAADQLRNTRLRGGLVAFAPGPCPSYPGNSRWHPGRDVPCDAREMGLSVPDDLGQAFDDLRQFLR